MSGRTWLGGIYLRGGGHNIVLRALNHYKKRVENIGSDPHVQENPTLRIVVVEEGKKTSAKVGVIIKIINAGINNPKLIDQVQFDVPIMEKALKCYQSDIEKIANTMQERYSDIFDEPKKLQDDLPLIKDALSKIKQFQ